MTSNESEVSGSFPSVDVALQMPFGMVEINRRELFWARSPHFPHSMFKKPPNCTFKKWVISLERKVSR